MADNQDMACNHFASRGVMYIGKYPQVQYSYLCGNIIDLIRDTTINSNGVFSLVDGQGVKRISATIQSHLFE
ncbi:hypothetical protein D3C78_1862470 [compost metagenome]